MDVAALLYGGGYYVADYVPAPPVQAPVGTVPPQLIASAFNVAVIDSDIASIDGPFNVVAAMYLDVGSYLLLFLNEELDAEYFVLASGGAAMIEATEKQTSYVMLSAVDVNGAPADPAKFNAQVYRI